MQDAKILNLAIGKHIAIDESMIFVKKVLAMIFTSTCGVKVRGRSQRGHEPVKGCQCCSKWFLVELVGMKCPSVKPGAHLTESQHDRGCVYEVS